MLRGRRDDTAMKIGFFGDGPWALKSLEGIVGHSKWDICFIVGRNEVLDEEMKTFAEERSLPFFRHVNVNSSEFLKTACEFAADIHVSVSCDQIIKKDLLSVAPKGFINCHAGALPFYRGRSIINWALINGEKKLGVTVHYIDEGIDTGDIIVQKFATIEDDDDYGSLLQKAYPLCAEGVCEALELIETNHVVRIAQDSIHPVGFYCPRRKAGDEWIDWTWTSERIHNFVRALAKPAPGAQTMMEEQKVAIWKTELVSEAPLYFGVPGAVVGHDASSIIVKTGDTVLRVKKMSLISQSPSDEVVPFLQVGSRFERSSS
jgi:methionyl-tRNA formyltransferase